jgi:hypothetical protein
MVSSPCLGKDDEFLLLGKIAWRWAGSLADVGMIIPKIIVSGISNYRSHIYLGIKFGDHTASGMLNIKCMYDNFFYDYNTLI